MLLIRRPKQWADRIRAYAVEVDGNRVGFIRAGEEKSFPVTAGVHRLRCRIDWGSSNTIEVAVNAGDTVSCEVRSGERSWRLVFRRPECYLSLVADV